MDTPKAALVSVYLGQFPSYFEFTKKTAQYNKDYKWIIFTDQVEKKTIEKNIEFYPYNLNLLNKDVESLLGKNMNITTHEKICDTKILWGAMYEKYFKNIKWYGFTDLDCVYGDFNYFLPDNAFEKYDIITYLKKDGQLHGPLTFLKNNRIMKDIYKQLPNLTTFLSPGARIDSIDEIHLPKALSKMDIKSYPGWEIAPKKFIKMGQYGKRRIPAKWEDGKLYIESLIEDMEEDKETSGHAMFLHIRKKLGHCVDTKAEEVINSFEEEYRKNPNGELTIKNHSRSTHLLYTIPQYVPTIQYLVQKYKLKKLIVNSEHSKCIYETYLNLLDIKIKIEVNPSVPSGIDALIHPEEIGKKFFIDIKYKIQQDENLPKKVLIKGKKSLEEEIKKEIIALGFTYLNWEDLTLLGQAKLFRNADVIITTNEPEIGNIVFSTPQTKIIQLTDGKPAGVIARQMTRIYNKPWQYHVLPNEEESIENIINLL